MVQRADNDVQMIDVADDLWLWRLEHPDWRPGLDWEPAVTSTLVESQGVLPALRALLELPFERVRHRVARRAGPQPHRVRAGAGAPAVARRRRVDGLR
jgi:hypothetical protein